MADLGELDDEVHLKTREAAACRRSYTAIPAAACTSSALDGAHVKLDVCKQQGGLVTKEEC